MNKLKENKGVSLSAFVITILIILLIVAVLGCVYFYKIRTGIELLNSDKTTQQNNENKLTLVDSKQPSGFAGSSNYKVNLYSNGEVYLYTEYAEGIDDGTLIAQNITNISNDENGVVLLKGDNAILINNDYPWIEIYKEKKVEISSKPITAEEKYNLWVQNVTDNMGKSNSDIYFQSVKLSNNKVCEVGLTSKGILYLTLEEQGSREFDTNVISFEICDVGNGDYKAAYYIKKDGTVSYITLDEYYENDGEIKAKKVEKAKNIVSIINNIRNDEPSYSAEVCLIDIEGNIYKN